MKTLLEAAAVLARAQRVACMTGAGVSAESGVATFRDAQTGLWSNFDAEQLASQDGFRANPGLVWRWYMERLATMESVQPNPGHHALHTLETLTPHFMLVTQNIDNLHERAGNQRVLHLHGNIARFHCNSCRSSHALLADERSDTMPPACTVCGDRVRPSVVWFGEMLPARILDQAYEEARACQVMLVVGTSGVVYPAAYLPHLARGNGAMVIDVNPEPNPISTMADLYLQGPGGEILPQLVAEVARLRAMAPASDR